MRSSNHLTSFLDNFSPSKSIKGPPSKETAPKLSRKKKSLKVIRSESSVTVLKARSIFLMLLENLCKSPKSLSFSILFSLCSEILQQPFPCNKKTTMQHSRVSLISPHLPSSPHLIKTIIIVFLNECFYV